MAKVKKTSTRFPRTSDEVEVEMSEPTFELGPANEVIPRIKRSVSSKYPWTQLPVASLNKAGELVGQAFYVTGLTTSRFSSQVAAAQRRTGNKFRVRQVPSSSDGRPRIGIWRIA